MSSVADSASKNTVSPIKKKITVKDFKVQQILGKGAYGDVFLAQKGGKLHAMKQIVKKKLHNQRKEYQALVEKQLLRCMKHPGIIQLNFAFQDPQKLYFVMEYCQGGEFISFLKANVKRFTEEARRYYVAQMVNILEYLHSNSIAHRDLKPQNLMLSKGGFLKLIDFGTAQISKCKIVSEEFRQHIAKQRIKEEDSTNVNMEGSSCSSKSNSSFKSSKIQLQETSSSLLSEDPESAANKQPQQEPFNRKKSIELHEIEQEQIDISPRKRRSTFVGTSYYISPQLLEENICEEPSDLWALGCIIYQLYYLETPFKDTSEYGIFQKIKKVELEFPKNALITEDAIDLIKRLLVKNPDERIGSCSKQDLNFKAIKQHKYFTGMDVDKIYQVPPPDLYDDDRGKTEQKKIMSVKQNSGGFIQETSDFEMKLIYDKGSLKDNEEKECQKEGFQQQSQPTKVNNLLFEGSLHYRATFPEYQPYYGLLLKEESCLKLIPSERLNEKPQTSEQLLFTVSIKIGKESKIIKKFGQNSFAIANKLQNSDRCQFFIFRSQKNFQWIQKLQELKLSNQKETE